jgi:hypothetical protein
MVGGRALGVAGLVLALALTGCDAEHREEVPAQTFEDGLAKDSEAGAFRVVLTAPEGLGVGRNTLFVRLGFHDPRDPLAPGRGIPGAEVTLDAWMPKGKGAVDGIHGVHVGDGVYEIDELILSKAGVWQLDFALAVGEGVDDSVSFAFVIAE